MFEQLVGSRPTFGVVLSALFLFVAASVLVVVIRRAGRRLETHLSDVTAFRFLSALAQVLVYLAAFVIFAHTVPGLRNLGHVLLAGVSIVSVVVGLAAQSTLGNLIAGLSLIVYRPVNIGDTVQVAAPTERDFIVARVIVISLAFTVLRDDEDNEVFVPNSAMMGSTVIRRRRTPA